ncbi:MAG: hypothetical protein PHQ52_00770 [Candidatus Omnitrophica bacterium]|nr:hypothetical protein [Candidatus Omnitrophota bacterium]
MSLDFNEKRNFLRYDYSKSIHYKTITPTSNKNSLTDLMEAVSKNLSISGILFATDTSLAPNISSLLLLNVDHRTANICHEIESNAMILNDKILGKVVRIEDNENGTCNVGVAFLKKTDPVLGDIEKSLNA